MLKFFLIYIIFIFICQNISFAQIKKIFRDTNIVDAKELIIGDVIYYVHDFKKALEDGKYQFYLTSDSSVKKLGDHLYTEGSFFNGKRNGTFKYYSSSIKKRHENTLYLVVNYKDGMLDGQYFSYNDDKQIIEEGNFTNDMKNGFFIFYNTNPYLIREIDVYDNNNLKYWILYNSDESIIKQGSGIESYPYKIIKNIH